jgi:hypothetical protein
MPDRAATCACALMVAPLSGCCARKGANKNLAALYTVVATCFAHELDPLAYLTDVLMRLDSTSADRVDELLPQNWAAQPP